MASTRTTCEELSPGLWASSLDGSQRDGSEATRPCEAKATFVSLGETGDGDSTPTSTEDECSRPPDGAPEEHNNAGHQLLQPSVEHACESHAPSKVVPIPASINSGSTSYFVEQQGNNPDAWKPTTDQVLNSSMNANTSSAVPCDTSNGNLPSVTTQENLGIITTANATVPWRPRPYVNPILNYGASTINQNGAYSLAPMVASSMGMASNPSQSQSGTASTDVPSGIGQSISSARRPLSDLNIPSIAKTGRLGAHQNTYNQNSAPVPSGPMPDQHQRFTQQRVAQRLLRPGQLPSFASNVPSNRMNFAFRPRLQASGVPNLRVPSSTTPVSGINSGSATARSFQSPASSAYTTPGLSRASSDSPADSDYFFGPEVPIAGRKRTYEDSRSQSNIDLAEVAATTALLDDMQAIASEWKRKGLLVASRTAEASVPLFSPSIAHMQSQGGLRPIQFTDATAPSLITSHPSDNLENDCKASPYTEAFTPAKDDPMEKWLRENPMTFGSYLEDTQSCLDWLCGVPKKPASPTVDGQVSSDVKHQESPTDGKSAEDATSVVASASASSIPASKCSPHPSGDVKARQIAKSRPPSLSDLGRASPVGQSPASSTGRSFYRVRWFNTPLDKSSGAPKKKKAPPRVKKETENERKRILVTSAGNPPLPKDISTKTVRDVLGLRYLHGLDHKFICPVEGCGHECLRGGLRGHLGTHILGCRSATNESSKLLCLIRGCQKPFKGSGGLLKHILSAHLCTDVMVCPCNEFGSISRGSRDEILTHLGTGSHRDERRALGLHLVYADNRSQSASDDEAAAHEDASSDIKDSSHGLTSSGTSEGVDTKDSAASHEDDDRGEGSSSGVKRRRYS